MSFTNDLARAKKIGGKMVCRMALYALIILETVWLLNDTRGGFANGILIFIQHQFNPFTLSFFLILFATSYFWGRNAGRDILVFGKPFLSVGAKYASLVSGIMLLFLLIMSSLSYGLKDALMAVLKLSLIVIVPMFAIWLLAAWQINGQQEQ